ncbi:MAG: response regulator [Nitrospinales bacterium]
MKRILIVGNKADLRNRYKENLEGLGYQVSLADDPQDAEKKLAGEKPDLITFDIQGREEDGIEFLEKCRKEYRNIPMILCTRHGSARQDFRVWASSAHVIKSANLRELGITVKTILEETRSA